MDTFDSLGLSPKVLHAVERMGYEQPTPVQMQAIPAVLEGHDLIAGAQTGTGKTAAFCLPCLDRLGHAGKHCGPLMLVVTPTRELADQIGGVCDQICHFTKHKVTTVVGGVSYNPQREALKRGTDVLIATPGRLEDLMGQDAASLDQVSVLVLDEADRMLDMGFLPAVKRIVKACTAPHQTLLFSATIDDRVKEISRQMLHDPVTVAIARRGETAATVDQYLVRISHAAKPSALKAILRERGAERVIVFARTRHRADSAARRINKMGFKAEALHSDKSQNQRRHALEQFAKGKLNVLVATDVLARGIDVDQVDYVVNYDIPTQPEDYVHRIGRTGRAGAAGCAITLVAPENAKELEEIQKLIKRDIPEMVVADFDVEAAESEAATRSAQLQARRTKDPEVAAVVAEMAKDKRKKRKATVAAAGADKPARNKAIKPRIIENKIPRESLEADDAPFVLPEKVADASGFAPVDERPREKKKPRKGRSGDSAKGKSASKRGAQSKTGQSRTKAKGKSSERPKSAKASKSAKAAASKPAKSAKSSKPTRSAQARDMRPGRAHRAEVAHQRNR